MQVVDRDWLVRQYAFHLLDDLITEHGDVLPWKVLRDGFEFDGARVTLIGARGIWKPAVLELPLSITTSWKDPYGDKAGEDGLLEYRYFGTDPAHPDNTGLRRCLVEGRPLVYFRAVEKGWYSALWPLVLVHDDPASLTFTAACEDVDALRPGVTPAAADAARRAYVTRMALVRLHQAKFRQHVLRAYATRCTVCRLRHRELLDAAHIVGDRHEHGDPVVRNGLALCKIHHAAFDANILGIRPDHVLEIRAEILAERDGPMLQHGLQNLHGAHLMQVPRRLEDRPDPERLEERYEQFRAAGERDAQQIALVDVRGGRYIRARASPDALPPTQNGGKMSVDERRRLELADAAKRAFGDDAGITLMELLPPVGWADVATKQDLLVLRGDLDHLRDDLVALRADVNEVRGDVNELRGELGELRSDLDVRLERGFRQILVTVSSLVIGGFLVAIIAVVAAALLR